jgi:hypothetical protein
VKSPDDLQMAEFTWHFLRGFLRDNRRFSLINLGNTVPGKNAWLNFAAFGQGSSTLSILVAKKTVIIIV